MNSRLSRVASMGVVLVLITGVLLAVVLSRPDGRPAEAEPTVSPLPSAMPARSPSPTRIPPSATPTRAELPTQAPITPATTSDGRPLAELSRLRFVDVLVVEDPRGLAIEFPPDMPLETLVGVSDAKKEASFFFTAPAPFVSLNGTAPLGSGFSESGGTGTAVGAGPFFAVPRANFSLSFGLLEGRPFQGTLKITDAADGSVVLVVTWEE